MTQPAEAIAHVFQRLAGSMELVERTMREQLVGESELMASMADHVLSSGGKRLRPALVLLTAELCGYTGPRSIQVTAASKSMPNRPARSYSRFRSYLVESDP